MTKISFREKLIEVRKSKGLTQTEVADLCSISLRTVQRIEAGKVTPRAYTIKQISEALGFDFFNVYDNPDTYTDKNDIKTNNIQAPIEFVKDLFNLKTNTMKKVSIISSFCLLIIFSIFSFTFKLNAQTQKKAIKETTPKNELIEPVKITFTNQLTFDELTTIKIDLENQGITIQYKKLEFDENNKLKTIACFIDCNDGFKGSFVANHIELATKKIGFSRDYDLNSSSPFETGVLKKTIILDVGHGGLDSGSFSKDFQEKEITLAIANKIKELSKDNEEFDVFLTRDSDQFISLKKRTQIINASKPDYIISLHTADSQTNKKHGVNLYTNDQNRYINESSTLTKAFSKSIGKDLKVNMIKNMNSHFLKNVKCPATLIELGYLSNPSDKENLTTKKGQHRIATIIFNALQEVI